MKKFIRSAAILAARYLPASLISALYRFKPAASLIRKALNFSVPGDRVEIEIAGGEIAGMKMILDLKTEKDYWLGTYEPELQAAARSLVKPAMVVYDVGANIGFVSLLMSGFCGETGQVYSFEALPVNLARLAENIACNQLEAQISVQPYAVIDQIQATTFLLGPSGGTGKAGGSAGRDDLGYTDSIEVDGISLDEFVYTLEHPAPDVIKIDIEGGEILALPGMRRLLMEVHPILLLELHGPDAAKTAWVLLSECGYTLHRMQPGFPSIDALEHLGWKSYLVALPA